MKQLKLTMVFKVPDAVASDFTKTLVKRMHKYLSSQAVVTHAVDVEIQDVKEKIKWI